MKNLICLISMMLFGIAAVFGQSAQKGLTISYGQFSVSYQNQPQSDAVILPFVEGKALSGSKERFGILFHGANGKSTVVEITDASGKVVKAITVNDYAGKVSSEGVKLISAKTNPNGRVAETVHEIKTGASTVKLITRALISGEKENPDSPQQLIITFSLASSSVQNLGLKFQLPFDGSADGKENGVVLSGKSASSAIAVSIVPKPIKISTQKNIILFSVNAKSVSSETPFVWLVAAGVNGASTASAKAAASVQVENFAKTFADPNIVVVNTASKSDAQPGDTVTYTLICKNVGLGEATNIQLSNPIPSGTSYLEGTASESGAEVGFERETTLVSQTSPVKTVKWRLKDPLKAGEERTVNFKVVIK